MQQNYCSSPPPLQAVNTHCFPALLNIPQPQFKLVLDSIIWAFKHTMRNVALTGESAEIRFYESAEIRFYESAEIRLYESAEIRLYESAEIRLYESAEIEFFESGKIQFCSTGG